MGHLPVLLSTQNPILMLWFSVWYLKREMASCMGKIETIAENVLWYRKMTICNPCFIWKWGNLKKSISDKLNFILNISGTSLEEIWAVVWIYSVYCTLPISLSAEPCLLLPHPLTLPFSPPSAQHYELTQPCYFCSYYTSPIFQACIWGPNFTSSPSLIPVHFPPALCRKAMSNSLNCLAWSSSRSEPPSYQNAKFIKTPFTHVHSAVIHLKSTSIDLIDNTNNVILPKD